MICELARKDSNEFQILLAGMELHFKGLKKYGSQVIPRAMFLSARQAKKINLLASPAKQQLTANSIPGL